jgi:hypothetical protein
MAELPCMSPSAVFPLQDLPCSSLRTDADEQTLSGTVETDGMDFGPTVNTLSSEREEVSVHHPQFSDSSFPRNSRKVHKG